MTFQSRIWWNNKSSGNNISQNTKPAKWIVITETIPYWNNAWGIWTQVKKTEIKETIAEELNKWIKDNISEKLAKELLDAKNTALAQMRTWQKGLESQDFWKEMGVADRKASIRKVWDTINKEFGSALAKADSISDVNLIQESYTNVMKSIISSWPATKVPAQEKANFFIQKIIEPEAQAMNDVINSVTKSEIDLNKLRNDSNFDKVFAKIESSYNNLEKLTLLNQNNEQFNWKQLKEVYIEANKYLKEHPENMALRNTLDMFKDYSSMPKWPNKDFFGNMLAFNVIWIQARESLIDFNNSIRDIQNELVSKKSWSLSSFEVADIDQKLEHINALSNRLTKQIAQINLSSKWVDKVARIYKGVENDKNEIFKLLNSELIDNDKKILQNKLTRYFTYNRLVIKSAVEGIKTIDKEIEKFNSEANKIISINDDLNSKKQKIIDMLNAKIKDPNTFADIWKQMSNIHMKWSFNWVNLSEDWTLSYETTTDWDTIFVNKSKESLWKTEYVLAHWLIEEENKKAVNKIFSLLIEEISEAKNERDIKRSLKKVEDILSYIKNKSKENALLASARFNEMETFLTADWEGMGIVDNPEYKEILDSIMWQDINDYIKTQKSEISDIIKGWGFVNDFDKDLTFWQLTEIINDNFKEMISRTLDYYTDTLWDIINGQSQAKIEKITDIEIFQNEIEEKTREATNKVFEKSNEVNRLSFILSWLKNIPVKDIIQDTFLNWLAKQKSKYPLPTDALLEVMYNMLRDVYINNWIKDKNSDKNYLNNTPSMNDKILTYWN